MVVDVTDAIRVTISIPKVWAAPEDPNTTLVVNDPRGGIPTSHPVRHRVMSRTGPAGGLLRPNGCRLLQTKVVLGAHFARNDVVRLAPAPRRPKCQRRSILGNRKEPFPLVQGGGRRPRVRLVAESTVLGARALPTPMEPPLCGFGKHAVPLRAPKLLVRHGPRVLVTLIRLIARRPNGVPGEVPMLRLQGRRWWRRIPRHPRRGHFDPRGHMRSGSHRKCQIRAVRVRRGLHKIMVGRRQVGRFEVMVPALPANGATVVG